MNPPSIADLLGSIPSSLGSYGPLIKQVEAALTSPHCNTDALAALIEKEVDLTARLLRFANSAFVGMASRLSSVAEAVNLMGIQQVHDLLSASIIIERFAGLPPEFVNLELFWQHSLATGICAKLIAAETGLPHPESFFVYGLLHDIGRLVLFKQTPTFSQKLFALCKSERVLLRDAEQRILGYDHQNVAEALLRKWKYPPTLVVAVGNHHQPAGAGANKMEASIIHLADHIVHSMQIGFSGERFVPPLNQQAAALVHFDESALENLVQTVDAEYAGVHDMFISK